MKLRVKLGGAAVALFVLVLTLYAVDPQGPPELQVETVEIEVPTPELTLDIDMATTTP